MTKKWVDRINLVGLTLNVVLVFSAIIAIWLASFYLARTGLIATLPAIKNSFDLGAILFSSAQISLFAISILIGFLTIVGWGAVEQKIREAVERETTERLRTVENEARGRSFAIQGYLIGEASVDDNYTKPKNEEKLREAIYYCEEANKFLKGTGLPVEYLVLNNLLGYYCALGETKKRQYLIDCAEKLRSAAAEHGNSNLLLTYCRTILVFSQDDVEIEKACSLLNDIRFDKDLGEKQKSEMRYLTSLCQKHHPHKGVR
jgi:hypothetical protein